MLSLELSRKFLLSCVKYVLLMEKIVPTKQEHYAGETPLKMKVNSRLATTNKVAEKLFTNIHLFLCKMHIFDIVKSLYVVFPSVVQELCSLQSTEILAPL